MNLCSLNENICLGPPVWPDYAKIISSQEDRPASHITHSGDWCECRWAPRGATICTTEEPVIMSASLVHTYHLVPQKKRNGMIC